MTSQEIFSSAITYQIIIGLIPIILTEFIKSDYNEKNFKNSFLRSINFILPIGIIVWIILENKNSATLNVYNILIIVFNFAMFLYNYFQSKISEQYKLLQKFSSEEINKVKEINHINEIQAEKMKAIVENQNYILAELSKINDRIIGFYKEK
jgi:hypothetical protein